MGAHESSSSSLHRVLLAAALALVPADLGCCGDVGCGGGFRWVASPDDGMPLTPGLYTIDLTFDQDTRYTIDCDVESGDGVCEDPVRQSGDRVLYFQVLRLGFIDGWSDGLDDTDGPDTGVVLEVQEDTGDGIRGPTEVAITLLRDGTPLLEQQYELDYVRNENINGAERCGYCDSLVARDGTWTQ